MKKKKIQHPKLYFNFNCTNDGLELFYYSNQLDLVEKLWDEILNNFETDGNRYQKIRSIFV